MTVREAIKQLQQFPPDVEVEVRASCCSHTHSIRAIRPADEKEEITEPPYPVVIDAR